MRILIDTNVIMDALLGRQPFFAASDTVLKICHEEKAEGFLAAHSVTNLFYMLRKFFKDEELRDILRNLLDFLEVEQIDKEKVSLALKNNAFADFEDGLQYECAKSVKADSIITRNKKDFTGSTIPVVTPMEFLATFPSEVGEDICEGKE